MAVNSGALATIGAQTMAARATLVPTPSLRYWRTQRAFAQRELADKVGVDITTIQRLERGSAARLANVRKLAAALKVTPAQLMAAPPAE